MPNSLDIEESNVLGVLLNKVAAGFYILTHQNREDLIGGSRILHLHLKQGAALRIQRGIPQLGIVHLAKTLITLNAVVFG